LINCGIWKTRDDVIFELNEYLINFMTSLQLEDVSCYYEIHEFHKQQQYEIVYYLLESYINDQYPNNTIFINDERIEELFGLGAIETIIVAIAGSAVISAFFKVLVNTKFSGNYDKFTTKLAVKYFEFIKRIQKAATSFTAKSRAANAIIYTNLEKCGKRCNIETVDGESNLSQFIEVPMKSGNPKTDRLANEQFACLLKCFVFFNISLGSALFNQYNNCMNNKVDRSLMLYLNQPESDSQCVVYYNIMKEQFSLYKDVIDTLPFLSQSEKDIHISAFISGPSALRSIKMYNQ